VSAKAEVAVKYGLTTRTVSTASVRAT
jgi:hypothetical protein